MEAVTTTTESAIAVPIQQTNQVGEARRAIGRLAERAGIDSGSRDRLALIVTELGSNLAKHAKAGELLAQVGGTPGALTIDVLSVDRGPGMPDIQSCMQDGFSTAGSPGTGLGAIRRLADSFDVYTVPGKGTVLTATIGRKGGATALGIETVHFNIPTPGETVCGDASAHHIEGSHGWFVVADGLGHGPLAADASNEAVRIFREQPTRSPADYMAVAHGALKKTRGAAVAAVHLDFAARRLQCASVGNITVTVGHLQAERMLPSGSGIVGHVMPRVHEAKADWSPGAWLMMHSDGLQTNARLDTFPGLHLRSPWLAAGMLYGQFKRGRDDTTVLIAREAPST